MEGDGRDIVVQQGVVGRVRSDIHPIVITGISSRRYVVAANESLIAIISKINSMIRTCSISDNSISCNIVIHNIGASSCLIQHNTVIHTTCALSKDSIINNNIVITGTKRNTNISRIITIGINNIVANIILGRKTKSNSVVVTTPCSIDHIIVDKAITYRDICDNPIIKI